MQSSFFSFPSGADLPWTGERYLPGMQGPIQLEHFHRYLFALRFAQDRDLIDVASGEGYGSALLAQVAKAVIGVDVDATSVENGNRRYGFPKLSFRVGDATNLPCESDSFDVAVSFETIEHVEDHDAFLSELKRVLRDDGIVVISTPDRPHYQAILTDPNPFHLKELDRQEFLSLLAKHFRHVTVFEQRSLYGSVMINGDKRVAGVLEFFHSENGTDFRRIENGMNSPYLVALASDNELPCCATSVMDSPAEIEKLRGDLGFATGEMWKLQSRVPELEAQCLALKDRVEQLTEELKKTKVLTELAKAETHYLRSKMKA